MALGVLAPLGMLLVSTLMLLDLRRDAWNTAEQTSTNLLQVIERDIARDVEIIDLSLQAVVGNLKAAGVRDLEPAMRQLVLFDRAATARYLRVMLALDENGDSVIDAGAVPARRLNNADRDYFQAHKARADLGLHISRPLYARASRFAYRRPQPSRRQVGRLLRRHRSRQPEAELLRSVVRPDRPRLRWSDQPLSARRHAAHAPPP